MKELTKKIRLVWTDEKQLKFPIEEMQGVTYVGNDSNTAEFDNLKEAYEFAGSNGLHFTESSE